MVVLLRQGTDSIMWFAASLFYGCIRKRLIDFKSPVHLGMVDPFVSKLLHILQRTKVDRILTTCLRICSVLFTVPLPALKATAKGFARSVLALVHGNTVARASAGRSELSECAIRAVTSLLRACQYVKVRFPCVRLCHGCVCDRERRRMRAVGQTLVWGPHLLLVKHCGPPLAVALPAVDDTPP